MVVQEWFMEGKKSGSQREGYWGGERIPLAS